MISISCGHLQTPFLGGLLVTLFYFPISTSSVISLIKKVNARPKARRSIGWLHKNGTKKSTSDFIFMFTVKSSDSSSNIQDFHIY